MEAHFNELTTAQAERLAILVEELGEAQQAVGKILRHGYESRWPKPDGPSNRTLLEREMGDVMLALNFMTANGDLEARNIGDRTAQKAESVRQWLHHN